MLPSFQSTPCHVYSSAGLSFSSPGLDGTFVLFSMPALLVLTPSAACLSFHGKVVKCSTEILESNQYMVCYVLPEHSWTQNRIVDTVAIPFRVCTSLCLSLLYSFFSPLSLSSSGTILVNSEFSFLDPLSSVCCGCRAVAPKVEKKRKRKKRKKNKKQ